MASTLNAVTTGPGGILFTGDTTGAMALQTLNGNTAVYVDTSQNVGIGNTSPIYKLHVASTNTSGDTGAILITSPSTDGAQFRINNTGSGGHSYTFYSSGSTNSIGSGALGIYDQTAGAYRTVIDSAGYSKFITKRVGMGSYPGASSIPSGKDMQLITWTGTKGNGTLNLLTTTALSEVPVCGILGINVMIAGQGTSRLYTLTGRYTAITLSVLQGGTRSAGEDAYLTATGGNNDFGLQLTTSGYNNTHGYVVWMIAGVQIANYTGNDKWLSD